MEPNIIEWNLVKQIKFDKKDKYREISLICDSQKNKAKGWTVSNDNKPLTYDCKTKITKKEKKEENFK